MKYTLSLIILAFLTGISLAGADNNFFNDSPSHELPGPSLTISGEVDQPGPVDPTGLSLHTVLVREAIHADDRSPHFVGAYRYEGYSLFDLLADHPARKKNADRFRPLTDLVIVVENEAGERAVFSWGEVFYTAHPHRILVATRVAPILPAKAKRTYPLPSTTRLICADDLYAARIIEKPVRIRVFTPPVTTEIRQGLHPLHAPAITLQQGQKIIGRIDRLPAEGEQRHFPCVYYGHGMGFHGFKDFSGAMLKTALASFFTPSGQTLREGYLVITGQDGYRITASGSEVFNRNDQAEFLLIDRGRDTEGGRFSIFPAADFFADRSVKAVATIQWLSVDSTHLP